MERLLAQQDDTPSPGRKIYFNESYPRMGKEDFLLWYIYACTKKLIRYDHTISSLITLKTEPVSLLIIESSFSLFPYYIAKSNPILEKIES